LYQVICAQSAFGYKGRVNYDETARSKALLALKYEDAKNYEMAYKYFDEALKIVPWHIGIVEYKAHMLEYLGRIEEAITFYKKALSMIEKIKTSNDPKDKEFLAIIDFGSDADTGDVARIKNRLKICQESLVRRAKNNETLHPVSAAGAYGRNTSASDRKSCEKKCTADFFTCKSHCLPDNNKMFNNPGRECTINCGSAEISCKDSCS
jgi:tetratricopeptide (TPR) repeat protein